MSYLNLHLHDSIITIKDVIDGFKFRVRLHTSVRLIIFEEIVMLRRMRDSS